MKWRPRRIWRLVASTLIGGAMVFFAVTAYAVQSDGGFSGTTADGAHEWHQDMGEVPFCARCHAGVAADIAAGPHSSELLSTCVLCHPPQFDDGLGHAAQSARCADRHGYSSPGEPHIGPSLNCSVCHNVHGALYGGAVRQLQFDAHAGIRDQLGEIDDAQVSKTCLTCHTHVAVNLDVIPLGPLELEMGN